MVRPPAKFSAIESCCDVRSRMSCAMGFVTRLNNQRLMCSSLKIRTLRRSQFVTTDGVFLKTHLQGYSIHSSGLKRHVTLWAEDQGSAYRSQNGPCRCITAQSRQRMPCLVCAFELGFRFSKRRCRIDDFSLPISFRSGLRILKVHWRRNMVYFSQ